ncbi:MAG: DMT family transporter [Pseudomonadota bacterium]
MALSALAIPLIFVFLWSTGFVGAALVAPYSEPLSILSLRFIGAAVVLLAFGLMIRGTWPSARRAGLIFASGLLIHGIYLSGVFWGIKNGMPSGVSALLMGLQPIVTAIAASPLLGERVKARHWAGLAIGLIGVALVISPRLTFGAVGITPATLGAHGIAVAGIVFGSIFQKRFVGQMDFKTEPGIQLLGGVAIALPVALLTESFHFVPSFELAFGYLWMTLILSCGAFSLYMYLLQQGEASKVAGLFYLVPVFAAVQGYLLFGETLTLVQLLGMAITTAAVLIASDLIGRREEGHISAGKPS